MATAHVVRAMVAILRRRKSKTVAAAFNAFERGEIRVGS
jgi:hypothetical protein